MYAIGFRMQFCGSLLSLRSASCVQGLGFRIQGLGLRVFHTLHACAFGIYDIFRW